MKGDGAPLIEVYLCTAPAHSIGQEWRLLRLKLEQEEKVEDWLIGAAVGGGVQFGPGEAVG